MNTTAHVNAIRQQGYSIKAPGFMGYVDGMHPKRLIDPHYTGRKAHGIPS